MEMTRFHGLGSNVELLSISDTSVEVNITVLGSATSGSVRYIFLTSMKPPFGKSKLSDQYNLPLQLTSMVCLLFVGIYLHVSAMCTRSLSVFLKNKY